MTPILTLSEYILPDKKPREKFLFLKKCESVDRPTLFENKNPASAMGLQRAVVAHGGHRLNVFYFH